MNESVAFFCSLQPPSVRHINAVLIKHLTYWKLPETWHFSKSKAWLSSSLVIYLCTSETRVGLTLKSSTKIGLTKL